MSASPKSIYAFGTLRITGCRSITLAPNHSTASMPLNRQAQPCHVESHSGIVDHCADTDSVIHLSRSGENHRQGPSRSVQERTTSRATRHSRTRIAFWSRGDLGRTHRSGLPEKQAPLPPPAPYDATRRGDTSSLRRRDQRERDPARESGRRPGEGGWTPVPQEVVRALLEPFSDERQPRQASRPHARREHRGRVLDNVHRNLQ